MNIQDQMRMASVKRWHIIDTSKTQNVAEHTFNVMLLYAEFCRRLDRAELCLNDMVKIMFHDAEEVTTGDIPSPAKDERPLGGLAETELIFKACDALEALFFIWQYGIGRTGDHALKYMDDKCREFASFMAPDVRRVFQSIWNDLFEGELSL